MACNYNPLATDDGECIYADQYYDCDNECLLDSDNDGICDELDICLGSDNIDADNDGLCNDDDPCYGIINEDVDNDGICDDFDPCTGSQTGTDNDEDIDDDGICDTIDTDNDNDGVIDEDDSNPLDPFLCSDIDEDSCEDCIFGTYDIINDGTENEIRFEMIPVGSDSEDTYYKYVELKRTYSGPAYLVPVGFSVLVLNYLYDYIHGIKRIEEKRDRVRYKYGRMLDFSMVPTYDMYTQTAGIQLEYKF